MNTTLILDFLRQVAQNNNRPWFNSHKDLYLAAKADFDAGVESAIARIATFDPTIAYITSKDATYRFYRDIRFSPDKSPYKRHFGAYIAAKGKKSLHGGYYLHIEPGQCMLACGSYYLPTNILNACRRDIMASIDEWRACVNNPDFLDLYGDGSQTDMDAPKGFGISQLKTAPAGFPRDYEHINYLRLKDYCCWHHVPDNFFEGDAWLDQMEHAFRVAKPMMDFVNFTIDQFI